MKTWMTTSLLALTLACTGPAVAGTSTATGTRIVVQHAWIRVLPGTLPAGGYARIHNNGNTSRTLIGASSPDYARVMLHRSVSQNGMSHMRHIKQLAVPAHATVTLAPGGYHLMFMQARHAVKPGDGVPVTLHFADGKSVKTRFLARPANATGD